MNTVKLYTLQTMRWTALAGSCSAVLIGGMIASSWLLFQFLVLLGRYLP